VADSCGVDRGAPRLCRGAANVWGDGGPFEAPHVQVALIEERHGLCRGAANVWGDGGPFEAPDVQVVFCAPLEDRPWRLRRSIARQRMSATSSSWSTSTSACPISSWRRRST